MRRNTTCNEGEFVIALCGNKSDLESVTQIKAYELADKHDIKATEVSAKTGEGIVEMFNEVAERIFEIRSR